MKAVTEIGPSDPTRHFHHGEFPVEVLRDLKGSRTVSVCLPARNEASRQRKASTPPSQGRNGTMAAV